MLELEELADGLLLLLHAATLSATRAADNPTAASRLGLAVGRLPGHPAEGELSDRIVVIIYQPFPSL